MQIELKSIRIRDLIDGYINEPDTGVKGYHGKLDIRPPYQREFRYDEKQRYGNHPQRLSAQYHVLERR